MSNREKPHNWNPFTHHSTEATEKYFFIIWKLCVHSFKECEKCWSNLTLIESRKCFVQSIHIKTELHGKSFRCKFTASRWDLSFNYWHIRSIWVNTHAIPFPHWFHCAHCIRPFFIAHMLRNTALEKSQPAQPIRENFFKLYFWWGR